MKQLLLIAVIFISLMSGASAVYANAYDEAYAERLKAAKNHARARILVVGLKRKKSIRESIFLTAIKDVEEHVLAATDHVSKSREYLLKGYHNGDIDEASEKKLKAILKKQKVDIAELRSSIDELYARHAKKVNKVNVKVVDRGPERSVVVNDFLDWLDFVTQLRKKESKKWTSTEATKRLWEKAAGDSGFYGIHINNLGDSVVYADNRERTSQQEYDYVRDCMRRFMDFHYQFVALLGKVKAAHDANLYDQKRKAEALIRPYLSQFVFSGLPERKAITRLPKSPELDLGYVAAQSMMQVFSNLSKKPSLSWITRDENVKQVLRALYDRGFAHEFLKKFVNLGGKFTVEVTKEGSSAEIVYLPLDGTLYIPRGKFIKGKLITDEKLLANLLNELFHAYSNKIIDTGKDPLTKNLLVNTEVWLADQFIRQNNDGGSKAWTNFASIFDDAKDFTQGYVGEIIKTSFYSHMKLWNKIYHGPRDSRITVKQATTDWAQEERKIMSTEYMVRQYGDRVTWEVQTAPPSFVLRYVHAFYGFGEFYVKD